MYATIIVFYDQFFEALLVTNGSDDLATRIYESGILYQIFFGSYLMILFISIYVANSLPIERAMPYFRFVAVVMSILVLSSIFGLCYYMSQVTF